MKTSITANVKISPGRFILLLTLIALPCVRLLAQSGPWTAPRETDNTHNPLPASVTTLADAKTIYQTNCSPCHGDKGRGDGPAAQGLATRPADHTSVAVQNESDGSLFWKLSEGRNPMPAYKKVFTEQQRWELILYIRSLAKTGKKK